jgi:nucleotide-binding universal stress UspA family protein
LHPQREAQILLLRLEFIGIITLCKRGRSKEESMIQTITVGTDGSETADKAVEFALGLAEKFGAKLVIASSYRPVGEDQIRKEQVDAPADIQWSINPTEKVDEALKSVEERGQKRGLETVSEAREGDPADVLCEIAETHASDLLIVGNKGMHRRVLGSVPNSVSHKAPCSVVIVKTT